MQDDFKKLIIGFAFTKDLKKVLLIHKKHPEWQKGKVNAVGGKLKVGEDKTAGMVREFFEETGIQTDKKDWSNIGEIRQTGNKIFVFFSLFKGDPTLVKSMTDEEIEWMDVRNLPSNSMTNLHWMSRLCLSQIEHNEIKYFTLQNNF